MDIHEDVKREILMLLQDNIINNVSVMAGHYTVSEIAREVLTEWSVVKNDKE